MSRSNKQAGFTAVEMVMALMLLGIVMVKLSMVVSQASTTHRRETVSMALEEQAYRVLDRVSYAVIGADPASLNPLTEWPFWTETLEFQVSLGVENGIPIMGDPEVIALDTKNDSSLFYTQDLGSAEERTVVWCNTVSELIELELSNGLDDNNNELFDEAGLSFSVDRDSIHIFLTLERTGKDGTTLRKTVNTIVTCRN